MTRDYYTILGVSSDATHDEIHRAFDKAVSTFRPGLPRESFVELEEAYSVLANPEIRFQYDQMRKTFGFSKKNDGLDVSRMPHGVDYRILKKNSGYKSINSAEDLYLPEEVLEEAQNIFADLKEMISENLGEILKMKDDVFLDLKITPQEAENGSSKIIEYICLVKCSDCGGSGYRTAAENCPKCIGLGKVPANRRAEIIIPPKVKKRTVLKVAGQGNFGSPSGNLVVKIKVKQNE